jgi:phosphoribosylglycinamide formyltransferase-1
VKTIKNIAIFISGKGSNAKNIIDYFNGSEKTNVKFVFSTKENPSMAEFCLKKGIGFFISQNQTDLSTQQMELCTNHNIDWVILAGYLKKITPELIEHVSQKIINIHPALLPDFGGKGMYGTHVHAAVLEANSKTSGITIHLVNEVFDQGKILMQYTCEVEKNETVSSLEQKIRELEMRYFPEAISIIVSNEGAY